MSVNKDFVAECLNATEKLYELVTKCENCLDVYVDYSLLRYPYISISAVLTSCNSNSAECHQNLYENVLELVLDIESLYKDLLSLEDIVVFRAKCGSGVLEYSYTLTRSSTGVQHVAKGITVVYENRRSPIQATDTTIINTIANIANALARKARSILEMEGIV